MPNETPTMPTRRNEARLAELRREWAARPETETPPVLDQAKLGARELRCIVPDLPTAQREAREYSYDYGDVHIVKAGDDYYSIYACELLDVPCAGADSASLTSERDWPIPTL